MAFETGLLLAQDHVDKTPVWDQINRTTLKVPEQVGVYVPAYFLQKGKVKELVHQQMKKKKEDATKKKKGKE